jgi:hypothetical protein
MRSQLHLVVGGELGHPRQVALNVHLYERLARWDKAVIQGEARFDVDWQRTCRYADGLSR